MPPPETGSLPVEIVRSRRRRRTIQATIVDGVIQVRAPATMGDAELRPHVEELVRRLERRYRCDGVDLEARAATLARRYGLPRPRSIRWSDVQRRRWGSCTPADGTIRISSRLAPWPPWVLDYVIVHELAHLLVADHSPAFHELVDRYPRAERARGFLLAKSLDADDSDGDDEVPDVDDPGDPGDPEAPTAGPPDRARPRRAVPDALGSRRAPTVPRCSTTPRVTAASGADLPRRCATTPPRAPRAG